MDGDGSNDGNGARPLLVGAVPPGGGISKLPLRGCDTGLEGWEQQCRRRTARRGAVGNVIVVKCAHFDDHFDGHCNAAVLYCTHHPMEEVQGFHKSH